MSAVSVATSARMRTATIWRASSNATSPRSPALAGTTVVPAKRGEAGEGSRAEHCEAGVVIGRVDDAGEGRLGGGIVARSVEPSRRLEVEGEGGVDDGVGGDLGSVVHGSLRHGSGILPRRT